VQPTTAPTPIDFPIVEAFYISLLVLVGAVVAWFAGYLAYKLVRGQG
jgi:hypothetical protein